MAIKAWFAFPDGYRLISGTHLNRIFTAVQQISALNVFGNLPVRSPRPARRRRARRL